MQPCLNGSAQAQAAARPKVKTKWPMNVRGEDLSQAPPALCPPIPSPSRLYIRCPHADANHIANHTERAWSLWLGISCCGISLSLWGSALLWGQPLTEFQAIIIGWRANMRKVFAFVFRIRLWYGMELIKFSAESVKFHCSSPLEGRRVLPPTASSLSLPHAYVC